MELIHKAINETLNIVSDHSIIILMVISIFLLKNKKNLLFYYVIGVFINYLINIFLKLSIRQYRPIEDERMINTVLTNTGQNIFKNNIMLANFYGMPSDHVQGVSFSTTFIILSLKNIRIAILYLIISLISTIRRIQNKSHSILQSIFGAIAGILFAYVVYYFSQNNIKSILKLKMDDNAPI